jgi:hypothetical protein
MPEKTVAGANVQIADDKKCNIVCILELADRAGAMGGDILASPRDCHARCAVDLISSYSGSSFWQRDKA